MSESCLVPYHDEIKTLLPLVGRIVLARHYHVSPMTVYYYAKTRGIHPVGSKAQPRSILDCYHDEIALLYPILGARSIADRYCISVAGIRWWVWSRGLARHQGQRAARWNTYKSKWVW